MERYQNQYQALGSIVYVTLVSDMGSVYVHTLLDSISKQITNFENQFSRFLETSELTAFNNQAGSKVQSSQTFLKLLKKCKELSVKADGLYNPFILPALQRAGYINSWTDKSNKTKIDYTNRNVVNIRSLIIGDSWAKIPKDTALDFGGIG